MRATGLRTAGALLYAKRENENSYIGLKPVDGDEQILIDEPFRQRFPKLSPNARWLAYQSNENGRDEIFVRAFPSMAGKQQISTSGGTQPVWSPDGKTLFYMNEKILMAVAFTSSPEDGVAGPGPALFEVSSTRDYVYATYDIAPDGKSFLFVTDTDPEPPEIRVVLNGLEELTGER